MLINKRRTCAFNKIYATLTIILFACLFTSEYDSLDNEEKSLLPFERKKEVINKSS